MYVKINRDHCGAHLAFCERCFGKFLRNPWGYERHCFEELRDDGSELLTVDLTSGKYSIRLVLDEEQRLLLAGDGWANYVDFAVPMYRQT